MTYSLLKITLGLKPAPPTFTTHLRILSVQKPKCLNQLHHPLWHSEYHRELFQFRPELVLRIHIQQVQQEIEGERMLRGNADAIHQVAAQGGVNTWRGIGAGATFFQPRASDAGFGNHPIDQEDVICC